MSERTFVLRSAFGLAAAAALVVVAAAAQEPRPTFRTEANYVRVDVYPTKDGAPVGDLAKDDFEVLEQGTRQRIEQFEHIAIRGNVPQEMRREPNTVAEAREAARDPRARVFVVFLDIYHVDVAGSHNIRKPLVDALDRAIGADDLVGVMTPEMSPSDITFARRTTTIEGMLARYWDWGERDKMNPTNPDDQLYGECYPNVAPTDRCADQNGLAAQMIDRRREKATFAALRDLVAYLRTLREERKAILAITDGWLQYRPDTSLIRPLACHANPDRPEVAIDPRTGKLSGRDPRPDLPSEARCTTDRITLSQIDDERDFIEILDEANHANASFYPIDPRGLAAFDTPLVRTDVPGPSQPTIAPNVDQRMLQTRVNTLRTLAEATDGVAIVNSNNLAGGLRRVVDDLSSYYLLGYYSSGKLDGKFHSIAVRVKRPGIQVRARRGYLAATPAEARAAAAAATALVAAPARADAEAAAVSAVIAPMAGYARDLPLRVQAAAGWKPGDAPGAAVWVEGELSAAREFEDLSKAGGVATVELAPADGASVANARATLAPGARTFRVALTPAQPLAPGEYVLRTSVRPADAAVPARDTLRLTIPPSPRAAGAIWSRRGQATANRDTPTADLRFRRGEQAKVEIPWPVADGPAARLLDRAGKALAVPVATAMRSDPDGSRWATAQVNVAPLAPGDYVIELSQGSDRTLAAFRVVP